MGISFAGSDERSVTRKESTEKRKAPEEINISPMSFQPVYLAVEGGKRNDRALQLSTSDRCLRKQDQTRLTLQMGRP